MSDLFANSKWRCAALALIIAAVICLSYAAVNHAVAAHYGNSENPDDWARAAKIEPGNAENWYRLGRYRQLDFDHSDLPLAVSYYRRAVRLDPPSSYYKLDLASTLEMAGDNSEAEKYFRGAQVDYPISGEVSWRYGNFLLRQQRLPEAYSEIHRALLVDPKLLPSAVSRAWRSNPDVHVLVGQVLPNTPEGDWEALSCLAGIQETTPALAVWSHLVGLKPAMDWQKLFVFTDVLVNQNRFDEAGSVWRQAVALDGTFPQTSLAGSLILDGGVEKDPSGGGFGWREQDVPGADFDFDTDIKHSGLRSARITFDGTQNLSYEYFSQMVLVAPNTRYRFRGFLRTDKIRTDSGVRFEIRDPRQIKDLDVLTPNETGTQPWTMEETEFTTGPRTHMIQIVVRRIPSARLDNKISGTVWVDDVAVIPTGASH